MWLIDITDFPTIKFREVVDPWKFCYAILSHVWNKPGDDAFVPEPTFKDLYSIIMPSGAELPADPIYGKLRQFCSLAHIQGYKLVWADMCCIDKTSSAELSEAIMSMYNWYRWSNLCYAYLKDISHPRDPISDTALSLLGSVWFRRGWTLQELVAPRALLFLDKNWVILGSRNAFANHIMASTKIHSDILTHKTSIHEVSVAQRMVWAAGRDTTRSEDRAYCLMGLFGVRIPVMYGEGTQAFIRLQEEILRTIPDASLLAWGLHSGNLARLGYEMKNEPPVSPWFGEVSHLPLPCSADAEDYPLATSPEDFAISDSDRFLFIPPTQQPNPSKPSRPSSFQIVPCHVLRISAPIIPLYSLEPPTSRQERSDQAVAYLVLLGCKTYGGNELALLFSVKYYSWSSQPFLHLGHQQTSRQPGGRSVIRIVTLTLEQTFFQTSIAEIYVPACAPLSAGGFPHATIARQVLFQDDGSFRIDIAPWCKTLLAAKQYCLYTDPQEAHSQLLSLPPGYETCTCREECPAEAASPPRRCPNPSGVLKITFVICQSPLCRDPTLKETTGRPMSGGIQVHVGPPQAGESAQYENMMPACRGPDFHLSSWTFQDDAATSSDFFFSIRRGDDPAGFRSARDIIKITLTLVSVPSDQHPRTLHPRSFLLEVELGKYSPALFPTRILGNVGQRDGFNILTAKRQIQHPLATLRRWNSDSDIIDADRLFGRPTQWLMRRRSLQLRGRASAAFLSPFRPSASPTNNIPPPAPHGRHSNIGTPIMTPYELPAVHSSPLRYSRRSPSPQLLSQTEDIEPASDAIMHTVDSSSASATRPAAENHGVVTEIQFTHASSTSPSQGQGAAGPLRAERDSRSGSPDPRKSPLQRRRVVMKAVNSSVQRILTICKWKRSSAQGDASQGFRCEGESSAR